MSRTLCTTIATTSAELESLRPAWDELYERCPHATPFQSYGWLFAWWASFGQSGAAVITVTHNGRLLALAPFYVVRDGRGIRQLRLIGNGHTDYPDLLVEPDGAAESMAAIWEGLARIPWHMAIFTDLASGSPLLSGPVPSQFCTSILLYDVAPCLVLPADIQTFQDGLPRGLRRTLRRGRKRLEQHGAISCDRVCVEESEKMLEVLYQLHTDQWRRRNRSGVLREMRVREFHRRVVRTLSQDGTVRLWAMRCNEEIIAVKYTLWRNRCVWSYISGINQAYRSLGLGALLFEDVIGQAIGAGCTQFDFLRGGESYKYVWGASDKQLYKLVVGQTETPRPDDTHGRNPHEALAVQP